MVVFGHILNQPYVWYLYHQQRVTRGIWTRTWQYFVNIEYRGRIFHFWFRCFWLNWRSDNLLSTEYVYRRLINYNRLQILLSEYSVVYCLIIHSVQFNTKIDIWDHKYSIAESGSNEQLKWHCSAQIQVRIPLQFKHTIYYIVTTVHTIVLM